MIAPDELPGAGIMYYNEEQIYGAGIVADYVYSTPIGMKEHWPVWWVFYLWPYV